MLVDVALGRDAGVGPQQITDAVGEAQEVQSERAGLARTGKRGSVVEIENEPRDDRGEVGRFPVAVNVRLGKTDVTREHALLEKRFAAHADVGRSGDAQRQFHGEGRGVVAKVAHFAVG